MNDNNLQQTLLQQEVTPPNNVWEKIAVDLNEAEEDAPLRKKILAAAVHPPHTAWDAISQILNEEESVTQLLNKEVTAPVDVWEKISLQLDKESDAEISSQLNKSAVTPPAFVWDKVEKQLEISEPAKVIPIKTNYKRFIQLAAAALVTGLITWGINSLLKNDKKEHTDQVTIAKKTEGKETLIDLSNPPTEQEPVKTGEESSSRSAIRKKIKTELQQAQNIVKVDVQDHSIVNTITAQTIHHAKYEKRKPENGFSESEYFLVMNEDGDLVRVTKRINNLKCVKSEEIPVDAATALNTRDCNNQIKQWQAKMALSTSLANASGIIDIADIIKTTEK